MVTKSEMLRKQEEEGRSILQMKPIDRTAYVAWSDALREAVASAFGPGSREHKELFVARREISVRFDSDPSYYLTQLAANLRRELSVLKKCLDSLGEGGAPAGLSPRLSAAPVAPSPAAAKPAPARQEAPGRPKAPAVQPKTTTTANLHALLEKLRGAKIRHWIRDDREGAVSIDVSMPGEHWEIDLLADGTVEVEVFRSDGSAHGEAKLEELFRRFSG